MKVAPLGRVAELVPVVAYWTLPFTDPFVRVALPPESTCRLVFPAGIPTLIDIFVSVMLLPAARPRSVEVLEY